MSSERVRRFYDSLVKAADFKEHGEKPILLMAILKYMIDKNQYGADLLELLRIKHARFYKQSFYRLAQDRLANPVSSWNQIITKFEMKEEAEKFSEGDVSEAFAKLTPKAVQALHDVFMENYKKRVIER